MCYALYISTDIPIKLIPWNDEKPSFYISEITEKEKVVKVQFSFSNVYYAGAHEGCGCGFVYDDLKPDANDAFTENEKSIETAKKFIRFLNDELINGNKIELYFCWEGEQGDKPKHFIEIRPSDLLRNRFPLKARSLVKIK